MSNQETIIKIFENDENVIERARSVASKKSAIADLKKWYLWLQENGGELAGLTPTELLEFPEKKKINKVLRRYVNDLVDAGLRENTIITYHSRVRGFFRDNDEALPESNCTKDLRTRVKKQKSVQVLTPILIRRSIDPMKVTHKAAVMIVFQACLDKARFTEWNLTGWKSLNDQLDQGKDIIRIDFFGRKKNNRKYHTYFGKDALDLLKIYLRTIRPKAREYAVKKARKNGTEFVEAIFYTQAGTPMTGNNVANNWTNAVKKQVPREKNGDVTTRYGTGLHNLRDVYSTTLNMVDGLKPWILEFLMGHVVDANGYNTAYNDEAYMVRGYRKALRYLNILSDETTPFNYISTSEAETFKDQLDETQNTNAYLLNQIEQLKNQLKDQQKTYGDALLEQAAENLKPRPVSPDMVEFITNAVMDQLEKEGRLRQ
jgi:site-specific recombinase XerD